MDFVIGEHRRSKSIVFLFCCALAAWLPHICVPPKNYYPAISLAFLLGGYGLRVVWYGSKAIKSYSVNFSNIKALDQDLPNVDVLVSAKDEESVVGKLVHRLVAIRYPKEKIQICIINDGSTDKTSQILEVLKTKFSNLRVINRTIASGGGKSGALNDALTTLNGEWVFILDADADFYDDILLRLIPFALQGSWSAVQLRKAVVNSKHNFLTSSQAMEMAMDTVIQYGRQQIGGVVELRGNGALLKRSSIDQCGGFNEQTVTDDLDLSFRLLLSGQQIGILWDPPIHEEAVETISALLRQRKRWAEGGLQRFFDYWPLLLTKRLTFSQKFDLGCFFLLQYVLPVISFIDLFIAIITKSSPVFWPLSLAAFSISGLAYFYGCSRRNNSGPSVPYPNLFNLITAILYLLHWFFVIPITTIKMAFLSKNLVWAKTIHKG